ncbi:hypothetical protein SHKM778_11120 [Streptomyces sp. KM77-8]|uniref:Uncharacterized protein n=1 Tax=Streptomyces haneummycinicus TaxID=3074435 RepID=A0AAT9HBG1_9ACTN
MALRWGGCDECDGCDHTAGDQALRRDQAGPLGRGRGGGDAGGARLRLDYSARSLWSVDRTIGEIRREGAPYAAVELVLRGFGAYAGEVIVRQTGGEWWASGGDHWVRTPDGRLWEPLDEARRCYTGDGSLRLLCRDASDAGPRL